MPYCDYDDLVDRLGEGDLAALSDHDGDGEPDTDVVEEAIASACALMDSYLAVRFAVPVELPGGGRPPALKTHAVNLAVYFLRLGRDSVTEDAREQYREDVAWLGRVAAGQLSIGVDPAPDESAGASSVRYETQERVFGRDEPL